LLQTWLLFIAHILSDFVFQSDGLAKEKREGKNKLKAFLVHGLIVWGFSFLFLLVIKGNLFEKLFIALLLAIVHCIIDAFMIKCSQLKFKNINNISQILLFFIDQLIHFIVI
jgi:hypothetical protein